MRPGGIQRQVSIPTNLGNSGINNSRIKRSGIKPKDLAPTPHDGRSLDKPLKQAPQVKRQLSDLDGPGTLRLDLSTRRTVEVPPPEQQGGERRSVQWQRELELLPGTLKQGRGGLQDDPVGDLRQSLTGKRTLEAPLESKETLRQIGEPRQSLESKQTHEGPVEPKGRGLPPQPKKGGNLSGKQKSPVKDFDFYDYYKKKEVEKYEPFVSGELSPSAHIKRFDKEHHSRYRDYYDMEGKYRVFYHLQADPDCCFYLFSKPGKKEMERLSKYRDEVMAAALANVYHSHINALEYLYEHKRLNEERDDVNFFLHSTIKYSDLIMMRPGS